MAIIPPPPYTLTNGTTAYGSQVLSNITNITNAVNANAAANGANADITSLTALATLTASGNATVGAITNNGALMLASAITPPALTANTPDYAPTGLSGASTLRLSATTAVNLSGIAAQPGGTFLLIRNIGTVTIALTALDSASAAANQFDFQVEGGAGAVQLPPQGGLIVSYDATQAKWVLASTAALSIPQVNIIASADGKRQTAITGPTDANGFPAFLASSGLNVSFIGLSTATPLIVTAAQGYSATGGAADVVGVYNSNASLGSLALPASATSYIFLNTLTGALFSSTLAPIYQMGGAAAITSGQFTFNIKQMAGYLGNGTAAVLAPWVCLGMAITSATAVTTLTPFAYNGEALTPQLAMIFNTATAAQYYTHNIGVPTQFYDSEVQFIFTTAYAGYPVGAIYNANHFDNAYYAGVATFKNDMFMSGASSRATNGISIISPTGVLTSIIPANHAAQCYVRRKF